LFIEVLRNMLDTNEEPLACWKFCKRLRLSKDTIWRWGILVFKHFKAMCPVQMSRIIEADETSNVRVARSRASGFGTSGTFQCRSLLASVGMNTHRESPRVDIEAALDVRGLLRIFLCIIGKDVTINRFFVCRVSF
jgi:hypothetical protein